MYVVFGRTEADTNSFAVAPADRIKTWPSAVLSSKSKSTAVAELRMPSSAMASDFVTTAMSSHVMPLNRGSPHVIGALKAGSPTTSVPVRVSVKMEYVTGAGGCDVPSPDCVPVPIVDPAKAFPKILASKLKI